MLSLCSCWGVICGLVGAAIAFNISRWVYVTFIARASLKKYRKAGNWAVVTGASDGIGKEFAIQLAQGGFNVALVSRTKSKLEEVASECKKRSPTVETKTLVFDFSTATAADYLQLGKALDALPIGILVNNVGVSYDHPTFYEDVDVSTDLNVLKVNCESQLQLTKMALRQMKPKRCGAIINLSSFSGMVEPGLLATYGATKAFNKSFSLAIATEVLGTDIDVLAVTPNFVISNMSGSLMSNKSKQETFVLVSAKGLVEQTLHKVGVTLLHAGHWRHAMLEIFWGLFPRSIRQKEILKALLELKRKGEKK